MTAATQPAPAYCWVRSASSPVWHFRVVRKRPQGWVDATTGTVWPEAVEASAGHPDHDADRALFRAYGPRWEEARAKALAAMPTGLADRIRNALAAFSGPKTITTTEGRK
jgi:hypothetical protein